MRSQQNPFQRVPFRVQEFRHILSELRITNRLLCRRDVIVFQRFRKPKKFRHALLVLSASDLQFLEQPDEFVRDARHRRRHNDQPVPPFDFPCDQFRRMTNAVAIPH